MRLHLFRFFFKLLSFDGKKIVYKMECKRLWGKRNESALTVPKVNLHPKMILCISWEWKKDLFYESL